MADDLSRLLTEFQYFKKEWTTFRHQFETLRDEFEQLKTELGVREGELLSDQVKQLAGEFERKTEIWDHTARDVTAARKLLEYNETNVKEIMRALSMIYRSVDELEKTLIANRETE